MNAIASASVVPLTGPKLDNRRVIAGIIDLLIVGAGAALILAVAGALGSGERSSGLGVVVLGWALYYYFACESAHGQTVGKKVMKLRVLRTDGSPAGMGEIAVRTLLRVIDGIAFYVIGLVVMLVTGERRGRLGDLAGGTIVADASSPVAAAQPAAVEESDAPTRTITLPPRPDAAPIVSEAPAVPEPRPFEPELVVEPVEAPVVEPVVEEPAVHEPVVAEEPVAEPVAEEPVVEPVGEEPVADEPVVEPLEAAVVEPVAEEPVAEEPVVEESAAPAVESLPDPTSPALRELADDVAAAGPVPTDDEPLTIKSVETVSAIDLVMGGEDDVDEQAPPAPNAPAS